MNDVTRRTFIKGALATSAGIAALPASTWAKPLGANNDIRVAIVGFRGHGGSHIRNYQKLKGVRVVALCDADRDVLANGVADFAKRNQKVKAYPDIRKLLEDDEIDAVSTATPNHWHSLVTVWACQHGKHVCVEKPVSHNIFEGRRMVDAARKYDCLVQADLDLRSVTAVREAVAYLQSGALGKTLIIRGRCFKRRASMGKVQGAGKPPESVDYNLWCGPAPMGDLRRKNLHYDWHWVWDTGCGELGNNGPHQLDLIRWALGQDRLPPRVMSVGGRFGYDDDGETPNTQIAFYDYQPAPIIYEVRGLGTKAGERNVDAWAARGRGGVKMFSGKSGPGANTGVVAQCEHGWVDLQACIAYDNDGKVVKEFERGSANSQESFIKALRSGKRADLRTDILEGHLSTALCHLGNISHRVGETASNEEIGERLQSDKDGQETFARFQAHLDANGVDLKKTRAVLGPWLHVDAERERFTGEFGKRANQLLTRDYRPPFVVPEKV